MYDVLNELYIGIYHVAIPEIVDGGTLPIYMKLRLKLTDDGHLRGAGDEG